MRTATDRPRHPEADQAELAYRIGCDAAVLQLECTYADAPEPLCHELLPWFLAAVRRLRGPGLPVDALCGLAVEWRRRRAAYFSDADWADVRLVPPFDRPAPSVWWRLRRGREPVPPRP
ncbi:hypothetical protein LWC33_04640 [Pseudonocardia sp. RS11V-5]|uniref:hypothetical protein n=1 Tax=Pseudonocardia terrae TaxID=2905831 RepID=UPI001E3295B1|nr:hypothetical protein [Pseudonocardia terrae]MCE3550741.1 hypothetical protein [Pseudonocardia terrae]